MCRLSSLFVSMFSFECFEFLCNVYYRWIVELIIGRLLTWLLTIFTNWSAVYFVFKYSSVLIISVLYVPSNSKRPLPPSFFFTFSNLALLFYICQNHTHFSAAVFQRTLNVVPALRWILLSFLNRIRSKSYLVYWNVYIE